MQDTEQKHYRVTIDNQYTYTITADSPVQASERAKRVHWRVRHLMAERVECVEVER